MERELNGKLASGATPMTRMSIEKKLWSDLMMTTMMMMSLHSVVQVHFTSDSLLYFVLNI